jgi:spermidine synthase
LSLGYLLGGNWADRNANLRKLCLILGAAGIWTVAIPWMKHPVILLTEPWGLRIAVLLAATILFFPPLMFLGAVTPFAVRLKTTAVDSVGRTTGRLFAVSTMASVVSALLTGFFLVPYFGVILMTASVGGLLLVTSAAGLFFARGPGTGKILPTAMIIIGAVALLVIPVQKPDPDRGLIAVGQTPYAEIRVFDNEAGRHLLIDGGIHSRIDTARGISTLAYTAVMNIPKRYFDRPGRMLLIGIGGGSMVQEYLVDGWEVDAVDIDPEVIRTAKDYFGLPTEEANIFEMDGRRFLSTTVKKYDIVLLDAFGSSSIPFHLVTAEAFRLASSVLTPDGIFALNLICVGWHDPIVGTISATLREVFPNVLALPMAEPPDRLDNLILLTGKRSLETIDEPAGNEHFDPDWRFGPGYAVTHAWDNRFIPATEGIAVLTDDLNPVDLRSEEIKMVARKDLRTYFAKLNVGW